VSRAIGLKRSDFSFPWPVKSFLYFTELLSQFQNTEAAANNLIPF
jgi:hypothetical protein